MEILMIINAVANLIITISTSAFVIFVFGRFSKMDEMPKYEVLTIKTSLCK